VSRRLLLGTALLALALPLHADFASIASAIDAKSGVKRIWIPFLGLARAVVRVVEPHGVNDFQLVTFEGADGLDPHELRALMEKKAGPGFRPLVQVHSRRGEWNFIYAKPNAKSDSFELLILTHDGDETVLIRVDVDAEALSRQLGEPRHMSHIGSR
jgi:hypothetical protein